MRRTPLWWFFTRLRNEDPRDCPQLNLRDDTINYGPVLVFVVVITLLALMAPTASRFDDTQLAAIEHEEHVERMKELNRRALERP